MDANTVSATLLAETPIQQWILIAPSAGDAENLLFKIDQDLWLCSFRGISLSRIQTVYRLGIDVEPADAVFYTAELDKAYEYGGWPKVVLALDHSRLRRTYVELKSTASCEEILVAQETFPTKLVSQDGKSIWLSKLPETDPRIASPYEWGYARWIEGDPFDALKAVLLIARDEQDIKTIIDHLQEKLVGPWRRRRDDGNRGD